MLDRRLQLYLVGDNLCHHTHDHDEVSAGSSSHCCLRPATHAAHVISLTNLHAGPLLLLARSHCPNHPTASLNPNYAIGSSRTYTIPVNPRYNAAQQTSLTTLGAIVGVAYDGGMIYSPFAGPSYPLTGWTTSAAYLEGNTFDQCGGHSSSTTSPSYHYHVAPSCLLKQLGMTAGQHSPQIGWMADGFPLYGPLGPNGVVMQTCTVTGGTVGTSVCLDACGGYLADTGVATATSRSRGDHCLHDGGSGGQLQLAQRDRMQSTRC